MSSARINFKTLLVDGPALAPRRSLTWEAVDVLIKTEGDAMTECPFQTA